MRVLMPLPHSDFDPTEAAVPWKLLSAAGIEVIVATLSGAPANADPIVLDGSKLGLFRFLLRTNRRAVEVYEEFSRTVCQKPCAFEDVDTDSFDGIVLPGGHAPLMREYLESEILRQIIGRFFETDRIIAAVCHGVVAVARTNRADGKSVLYGRKTTALTEKMELLAWRLTRRKLGDYYRTYPQTVQREVSEALGPEGVFLRGPNPLLPDTESKPGRGFVVIDGNYLSARYPGDIHRFSQAMIALLRARQVSLRGTLP